MDTGNAGGPLSADERRAVFLALVQEQDKGAGPAQARRAVARRFGIREAAVRAIEGEGLDAGWPPLDDA
jgi:hypothetical protein